MLEERTEAVQEQHCGHSRGSELGQGRAGVAQLDIGPGINPRSLENGTRDTAAPQHTFCSGNALRADCSVTFHDHCSLKIHSFNETFCGFL